MNSRPPSSDRVQNVDAVRRYPDDSGTAVQVHPGRYGASVIC
jgi:hypothetical protein